MKLIATQTLPSDQPNITFTSIPQNFTDLVLFISGRTDRALEGDGFSLRFNGNQSGYSQRRLIGAGSGSPSSDTQLNSFFTTANNATANTFGNSSIYIPNYAGNANKSYSNDGVSENNAATSYAGINAGVWANTDAINSITLTPEGGTVFRANTTASLYGIGGAGDPGLFAPKATGGSISLIGGYYVHTFTASGTFTPTAALTDVEYLVVAGGGGSFVGGAGAGGYRSSVVGESSGGGASAEARLSLTAATNYTVTVGAGGAGGSASSTSGSDSVFSTITSLGGGRSNNVGIVPAGGSGGGQNNTSTNPVGAGTTGQGFAGGVGATDSSSGSPNNAGAGGGAGAVGGNATNSRGGNGGVGVSSSITGSAVTRAGGGGGNGFNTGGTGGSGGGGNGGNNAGFPQTNGATNTGGGGGGGVVTTAGNGGSGIVIVRYAA